MRRPGEQKIFGGFFYILGIAFILSILKYMVMAAIWIFVIVSAFWWIKAKLTE